MTKGECMKSIDEAIQYCLKIAEENPVPVDSHEFYGENMHKCKGCAKEHRQLAEWLKELKEYRNKNLSGCSVDNIIIYMLHKEFRCPLDECRNAYYKSIEYLRSKSKLRGAKVEESQESDGG